MPARPPLPQTARVVINSSSSNEVPKREAANVFYVNWVPALTPSAAELGILAGQILGAWFTRFKAFMNVVNSVDSCSVTMIDGSEVQGFDQTHGGVGTAAGGDLPASTSACISWGIGVAYRGGHPRSYLFGVDRGLLDSGPSTNKLSVGNAAAIAAAAGNLTTDMNTFTVGGSITQMGTVSYVRGKTPRVTPVFFPYGSVPRVNTRLATQRRRLGKLSVGTYET